jgi:hypothetical protein
MDNITPNNVVQPNVSVPAGEWKPAAWLPIVWTGEASKDSFVISSGKVVALDRQGRVVPAGYKKLFAGISAVGDTVITYASADVTAGVISLATGATCTAGAVTAATVATALLDRGLVLESEFTPASTNYNAGTLADVKAVLDAFVSAPVGVCAYDVYVWAGDAPESLNQVNYQKQHLIQFFTDMQMQVPHASYKQSATSTALDATVAWSAGSTDGFVFPDGEKAGHELFLTQAQLAGLARYSDLSPMTKVVGYALQHGRIAKNTDRTPIAESGSATLVRQRSGYNKLAKAGDFYVDADVGIIFLFSADGTSKAAAVTVTYFAYDVAVSTQDRQVCVVGDLAPGDYVTYDKFSNFVKLAATNILKADDSVEATVMVGAVGRVLGIVSQPKGLLERVRTAWDGSSFSATEQMPGTATAGYSDLITLSPENVSGASGVADQVVLINVKMS